MSPKRKSLLAKLTLGKRRAKNNLYYFDKHVLGYDLMVERVHGKLCKFVQRAFDQMQKGTTEQTTLLILMPRNSFKSSAITIGFALWALVNNPNLTIMITNEKLDKSKRFLKEIKAHIEDNDTFRTLFGNLSGEKKMGCKWSENRIDIASRTQKGAAPSIEVSSVESSEAGKHVDILIADDLVGQGNSGTVDQLNKVIEYRKDLGSVLKPGGLNIVIGTRWDHRDVYNSILDIRKELGDLANIEVMIEKAVRDDGTYFFPEVLTPAFLKQRRAEQGAYFYGCQYQNSPVNRDNALVSRIDKSKLKDLRGCNNFITLDLSLTESDKSDNNAFVVNAVDSHTGKWNIIHAEVFKTADPNQIIDTIFRLERRFNPVRWGIEKNNFQGWLKTLLETEMRKRGIYLNIDPPDGLAHYGKNQSKVIRLRKLGPQFNMGQAAICEDMTGNVEPTTLEDQLLTLTYDGAKGHDDLLDALAMQGEIVFWGNMMPVNKYENESYRPGGETFAQFHERVYGPQEDYRKVASGWTVN